MTVSPSVTLRQLAEAATEFAPGYVVTRDGQIISTSSNWRGYDARLLKPFADNDGYLCVHVSVVGVRRKRRIHRLVAAAYLPIPSEGQQLRHLNGDKTDNHCENLAWGTASENAADREVHGRTARGARNGAATLTEDAVREIRILLDQGVSQRAIARRLGIHQTTVSKIATRKRWSHVAE